LSPAHYAKSIPEEITALLAPARKKSFRAGCRLKVESELLIDINVLTCTLRRQAVGAVTLFRLYAASVWLPVSVGLLAMYGPIAMGLATEVWATDEQGHGPIIVSICAWLAWQRWDALRNAPIEPALVTGGVIFAIGSSMYVIGRMLEIDTLAVGSFMFVAGSCVLVVSGVQGLRVMTFPLLFMLFAVPLPNIVVQVVTAPLKSAVSSIAEQILYSAGYPIARSGVVLSVGQYQLLVADACAGLRSMFTLEALSLVYISLMRYKSIARNVALAVASIPIAFCANVIRVILLVLITYHYGNEVGQGFMHSVAGFLLFGTGLVLLLVFDGVIGKILKKT
jgi:exosortase B